MSGNRQTQTGARTTIAHFTVNALHILELVVDEGIAPGITIGVAMIHGLMQKAAARAHELRDPELDAIMNKMHLYEAIGEEPTQENTP